MSIAPALVRGHESLRRGESGLRRASTFWQTPTTKEGFKLTLTTTRAQFTPREIKDVARLARLAIDESDVDSYAHDLSRILDLVEQMNVIDTTEIEPMAHP